jgi:hypothetical protein
MSYEYTINTRTQSATADGELSDYANVTTGEEVTFELFFEQANDYDLLKELQKYSQYTTIEQTLGSVFYTVTSSMDNATVDSPVVQVSPGGGVAEAKGVWGVVTNVSDDTEIFGALARVDLTVGVLALGDEYDNHNSVINEFASNFGADETDEQTTFEFALESAFVG